MAFITTLTALALAASHLGGAVPVESSATVEQPQVTSTSASASVSSVPTQRVYLYQGKHTIKTCDDLIKRWRPPAMRGLKGVTVKCVNGFSSKNQHGNILFHSDKSGKYAQGPFTINIKRQRNVALMADVYAHEAWHAQSFSWSKSKQARFLKTFGKSATWTGGKTYIKLPAERWAWAANSCHSAFGTQKNIYYNNLLPQGCATVRYWNRVK